MLQFFRWATLTAVLLSLKPVLGSLEDMLRPFGWTEPVICADLRIRTADLAYLVAARIDRAMTRFDRTERKALLTFRSLQRGMLFGIWSIQPSSRRFGVSYSCRRGRLNLGVVSSHFPWRWVGDPSSSAKPQIFSGKQDSYSAGAGARSPRAEATMSVGN